MRIDWVEVGLWLFMAVMVLLLILCMWALVLESKECNDRGGKMVGTGDTTTVITYVNNVPIISTYEETECTR